MDGRSLPLFMVILGIQGHIGSVTVDGRLLPQLGCTDRQTRSRRDGSRLMRTGSLYVFLRLRVIQCSFPTKRCSSSNAIFGSGEMPGKSEIELPAIHGPDLT